MAESNQQRTQLEPNGTNFSPDDANPGQSGAYQYWQANPAGVASSSGHDKSDTSPMPFFT